MCILSPLYEYTNASLSRIVSVLDLLPAQIYCPYKSGNVMVS